MSKYTLLLSCLCFACITACSPSSDGPLVDLETQLWIHGSPNCNENSDPAIQVVQYNANTWILRQSKCTNYEAPFMFLFFGENKALLMDTGATRDEANFPLYNTVNELISAWEKAHESSIELIVAHTHGHGDHHAADAQFDSKANTTVIGLKVADVQEYFKIDNWPDNQAQLELGNRTLDILPIPGHHATSIAVYDKATGLLLTGDTFYPGRLYVNEWSKFKQSIRKLYDFTLNHDISFILGNHIEMTNSPGKDYAMGTIFQPDEQALPLTTTDLAELNSRLRQSGNDPERIVFDRFIVFPIN